MFESGYLVVGRRWGVGDSPGYFSYGALWVGGRPYPGWFRPGPVGCGLTGCGGFARSEAGPTASRTVSSGLVFQTDGVSMGLPEDGPDEQQQHSACDQESTPAVRPWANPGLLFPGPSPVVRPVIRQGAGQAETVHLSLPAMSGQSSTGSPQRSPLKRWGTRRFRYPLIASKRGVRKRCRQMEVSLVCRRTHRVRRYSAVARGRIAVAIGLGLC